MRVIEQTLSAGQVMELGGGKYFHIIGAANPVDVQFFKKSGVPSEEALNVGAGYRTIRDDADRFDAVSITSQLGQVIKVAHSEYEGDYNIIAGDVNALTTKKNLSLDGNQFFGGYSFGGSAGSTNLLVLVNDLVNNVDLHVNQIIANAGGAPVGYIVDRDLTGAFSISLLGSSPINKKLTGVAPKGDIQFIFDTSALSLNGITPTDLYGTPTVFPMRESPIIVEPGHNICIASFGQNKSLSASFSWAEVDR